MKTVLALWTSRFWSTSSVTAALLAAGLALTLAAPAAGQGSEQQLSAALAAEMSQAGPVAGAYVVDARTGRVLFDDRSTVRLLPGSLEKTYTTSTALIRMGPAARLSTRVLATGRRRASTSRGDLYLRGAGDFTFGDAAFVRGAYGTGTTVESVADSVRRSGIRRVTGSVFADPSLFSGAGAPAFPVVLCRDPLFGPSCPYGPAQGFERPMPNGPGTAVSFNRGLEDSTSPQAQSTPVLRSAQELTSALGRAGVRVDGTAGQRRTPGRARVLAATRSPRLDRLVLMTNHPSDNYAAETLFRVLGARFAGSGSRAGGARVVRRELARTFGIRPVIYNGSGDSPLNGTSPREEVTLLRAMRRLPQADAFQRSLSLVGRSGTWRPNDRGTPAEGRCRVKDGTLTTPPPGAPPPSTSAANVAGYCRTAGGRDVVFAIMTNGLPVVFDPATFQINSPAFPLEQRMVATLAGFSG
jgi:D-alanyl-D-alanine carboxypeptidase/D-alanyl-D-alanine-endopeptidase (penicillin-binding protein 4)